MGYMPIQMARTMVDNPDGYIRSNFAPGTWANTYVGDIVETARYDIEPAKRALNASLLERYLANAPQTVPSLVFCLGLMLFAHFVPVAIRRRNRSRRVLRHGTLA